MKKVIFLLLISMQFACGQTSKTAQDVEQFKNEIAKPSVVILDVRTPEEFAEGHLPNAVNIDYKAADFAQKVDSLDHNIQYEVYCRSGHRSGESVKIMEEKGFKNVHHLEGGILKWQETGNEVVK